MAKEEPEKKLLSEDKTDTVIYDKFGREIIRFGFTRTESEDDEGTEYYKTEAQSLETGDGTIIGPGHLMRPLSQGGVTLQRCSVCDHESRRNGNANPFSPSSQMRSCFHCRARLCERHTHSFNNHIVCARCRSRQFIIHRILKPIFFRREKS
jgi:hypothetical protein